jgi:hypothetical protein
MMGRYGPPTLCGACRGKKRRGCCAEASFVDKLGDLLTQPYLGDNANEVLGATPKARLQQLIQTVPAAQVALGKTAEILRQGYDLLPNIKTTAGLRDQTRSTLDQANNYAQRVYRELPSGALDATSQAKVIEAVQEAQSALTLVEEATQVRLDLIAGIAEALGHTTSVLGRIVGAGAGGLGKGIASGLGANIIPLVLVGGLVFGGLYAFKHAKRTLASI